MPEDIKVKYCDSCAHFCDVSPVGLGRCAKYKRETWSERAACESHITKRKAYLAKCSKKEKWIRANITYYKQQLTSLKMATLTKNGISRHLRGHIRHTKYNLTAYRHELHILKGMYRVVVPRFIEKHWSGDLIIGRCACGDIVSSAEPYCMSCSRRILWEKVK